MIELILLLLAGSLEDLQAGIDINIDNQQVQFNSSYRLELEQYIISHDVELPYPAFPLPNSTVYKTEELEDLVGTHMAKCRIGQDEHLFKEEFMKTCD